MNNTYKRLFIPNNPTSLRICPELAQEIGLNESIVLLQIEFLISISRHIHDDRRWTYQSVRELKERYFPFWTERGIQKVLSRMIDRGFLFVGRFNKAKYDRTNWYAIAYERIISLKSVTVNNVPDPLRTLFVMDNEPKHQPIPETTTEITTENIKASYKNSSSYGEFLSIGEMLKNKKEYVAKHTPPWSELPSD